MADYTVVNLKQVEDRAPSFGFAPQMEARFATDALELSQSGAGYERFAANFRVPFGHSHKRQEEIYVVVSGSGRMKIEDEIVELRSFDALRVPPGTMRCFEAGPEGAEIVAFGAPHAGENRMQEADVVPGWWTD